MLVKLVSFAKHREDRIVQGLTLAFILFLAAAEVPGLQRKGPEIFTGILGLIWSEVNFCQSLLCFYLYWVWRFGRGRMLVVTGLLGALCETWMFQHRPEPIWMFRVSKIGAAFGLIGLGCLLVEFLKPDNRKQYGGEFWQIALIPLGLICSAYLLSTVPGAAGVSYDLYLHAADMTLGVSAAALARVFVLDHHFWMLVFDTVYLYLSLVMGLTQLLCLARPGKMWINPVILFTIQGFFAGIFFTLMPAVGSASLFLERFPRHLPVNVQPVLIPLTSQAALNCLPSMHFSWALGITILLWPFGPKFRAASLVFLLLTAASIFACGNHYIMDLLLAPAFTVALCLGCHGLREPNPLPWLLAGGASMLTLFLSVIFLRDCSSLWLGRPEVLLGLATGATLPGLAFSHRLSQQAGQTP